MSFSDKLMSVCLLMFPVEHWIMQSDLNNRVNGMKLTEQTLHKLSVLIDVVVYLEKRMYVPNVSNEEWDSCFEIKQDIKNTIFAEMRARINEIPSREKLR